MSAIRAEKGFLQSFCEMAAEVIDCDMEIIDNSLRRVAGTGKLDHDLGEVLDYAHIDRAVQLTRRSVEVTCGESEFCRPCSYRHSCVYRAGICVPIIADCGTVLGSLAMVALGDHEERALRDRAGELSGLAHGIARLLSLANLPVDQQRDSPGRQSVHQRDGARHYPQLRDIISISKPMKDLKSKALKIAAANVAVLIVGETGVGKEILARAIHNESDRRNGPFVAVNCSAVPESLAESEFFGYADGAFTGATKGGKSGWFMIADGGTLFLDEIGELPLALQAKLLRILEENVVYQVGGTKPAPFSARIIAATNQDLGAMVAQGRFRPDLYYRLSTVILDIPPLREHRQDISLLVDHFADYYGKALNKPTSFPDELRSHLVSYNWPGNVRELKNVVCHCLLMADGCPGEDCLPRSVLTGAPADCQAAGPAGDSTPKPLPLLKLEEEAIRGALAQFGHSLDGKRKAAEALGISVTTLYRRLKDYGVQDRRDNAPPPINRLSDRQGR